MRLIHTSDWHLGRSFHQVGLLDAQAQFADFLVELTRAEQVDAVLVSGDIYDRALPTPDTVALLDETLTRLVETGAPVVLISGNHDSPVRLGFGARLLEHARVHVRSRVEQVGQPIVLGDSRIHAIPYCEPSLVAESLGVHRPSHAGVLRAAMDRIRVDLEAHPGLSLVLAHAFVAGGVGSESERDIAVGGVSVVPADVFAEVDYVALGHLHRPQTIGDRIAYSGSPLAMSFGEADQVKSVSVVELTPGRVEAELVPTPVPRRLAVLRGHLDEVLSDRSLVWAESAWCQVVLTDPERPLGALERVRARFPHTLSIGFEPADGVTRLVGPGQYAARVRSRATAQVCHDFLTHVRAGAAPTPPEQQLLAEAIEATRVARGPATAEAGRSAAPADEPGGQTGQAGVA